MKPDGPGGVSCIRAGLVSNVLILSDSYDDFFFFQAEDGIRDSSVTGVQTCALPILLMEAEQVLESTEEGDLQIRVLCGLGIALAKAQQWEWAEAVWGKTKQVINTVEKSDERAKWLCTLGEAMEKSGQVEQADAVWAEAEQVINIIKRGDERDWVLRIMGEKLVAGHRWVCAAAVIGAIERGDLRAIR